LKGAEIRMKFVVVGMPITIAVITAACSGSESPSQAPSPSAQTPAATPPPGNMKEIGKKEAAGYVITLSSESGSLKQGSNNLTLEFRKGDQLADPGKVEVKPMMEMTPSIPPSLTSKKESIERKYWSSSPTGEITEAGSGTANSSIA